MKTLKKLFVVAALVGLGAVGYYYLDNGGQAEVSSALRATADAIGP